MAFNITKKWYGEGAPVNAAPSVGAGQILTFTAKNVGTEYDELKVTFVDDSSLEGNCDIDLDGLDITITIKEGTTTFAHVKAAVEAKDVVKDLIGVAIKEEGTNKNVAVTIDGNEDEEIEFEGGAYGTVCQDTGVIVEDIVLDDDDTTILSTDYYINIAPNSIYDANWRKITLSADYGSAE